jgi:hypothetical protein
MVTEAADDARGGRMEQREVGALIERARDACDTARRLRRARLLATGERVELQIEADMRRFWLNRLVSGGPADSKEPPNGHGRV